MSKTIKCSGCDEKILKDGEFFDGVNGKIYCQGCYESAWEHPSTLIEFREDGTNETIQFCQEFGSDEGEIPTPVKKQKWVSTDGWRGYTDWELQDGFIEVADGWVTGYPDETVKRKVELNDIFEDLKEGRIIPPCRIYWIFGITSNVFSTASSIVIEKGNEELLEEWLNEINGGIEGLKEKLS